jgi:hypothetical protein
MSTYRQGEIYIQRSILAALNLVKNESETAESVAEKYLLECLKRDHPGIMDVVGECEAEFELARANNKKRVAEWKKASPCCGLPVDEDLKICPKCKENV